MTDPAQQSLEQRLASKLAFEGDCVVFTGYRNQYGYGIIQVGGKARGAHRVSWELINGTIPDGLEVCHHCDNPPCVYVGHLFLGTHAENMRDSFRKGRTIMPTNGADFQRVKTHCPSGHLYTIENVQSLRTGWRSCVECNRIQNRVYKAANRDLINERRRVRRAAGKAE